MYAVYWLIDICAAFYFLPARGPYLTDSRGFTLSDIEGLALKGVVIATGILVLLALRERLKKKGTMTAQLPDVPRVGSDAEGELPVPHVCVGDWCSPRWRGPAAGSSRWRRRLAATHSDAQGIRPAQPY